MPVLVRINLGSLVSDRKRGMKINDLADKYGVSHRRVTRELVGAGEHETRKAKLEREKRYGRNCRSCGESLPYGMFPKMRGEYRKTICFPCQNKAEKDRRREPQRKAYHRSYIKERRSNPRTRLTDTIASHISACLKGKSVKWSEDLLFTKDQLVESLESQFKEGMTWDNYGEWHVDHYMPKSDFKYETPADQAFHQCWSISNLRPLWAVDNIKKGTRFGEFR